MSSSRSVDRSTEPIVTSRPASATALRASTAPTGPVAKMASMESSASSAAVDLLLRRRRVGIARRRDAGDGATERVLGAVAAGLEADVGLLLHDAQQVGATGLGELLAGALPGDELVLADVGDRAELLVDVGAGVDRDHRDAGVDGGEHRILERSGVGERHDEPVDALADGRRRSSAPARGRRCWRPGTAP